MSTESPKAITAQKSTSLNVGGVIEALSATFSQAVTKAFATQPLKWVAVNAFMSSNNVHLYQLFKKQTPYYDANFLQAAEDIIGALKDPSREYARILARDCVGVLKLNPFSKKNRETMLRWSIEQNKVDFLSVEGRKVKPLKKNVFDMKDYRF